MDSFGKTLKEWREKKGWSQDDFAQIIGVKSGKQTISRWELGKAEPALSELRKIANVFESSIGQLLGEEQAGSAATARPGFITVPAEEYVDLQRRVIHLMEQQKTTE